MPTPTPRIAYIVSQSWQGGWNVVAMVGPDPLYVIDTCATRAEASALADTYNQVGA